MCIYEKSPNPRRAWRNVLDIHAYQKWIAGQINPMVHLVLTHLIYRANILEIMCVDLGTHITKSKRCVIPMWRYDFRKIAQDRFHARIYERNLLHPNNKQSWLQIFCWNKMCDRPFLSENISIEHLFMHELLYTIRTFLK